MKKKKKKNNSIQSMRFSSLTLYLSTFKSSTKWATNKNKSNEDDSFFFPDFKLKS